MENNLTNRRKFRAQYLYQEIFIPLSDRQRITDYTIAVDLDSHGYLELTPLSQITDEDAIKVAKIIGYTKAMGFDMRKKANMIEMVKEYLSKYLPTIQVGDYLRSKSYLLSFMGLSEEELINRGWAKIKEG